MPETGANVVVRRVAPPEVTRIEHPANGNFDVVIMQSGARDDLPDVSGMLSGNPVYTVFLRVGDQKEWLLEYCVPVRGKVQASPYQVTIEDTGAVTPPYPISTIVPNAVLGQRTGKHIVLHGLLTSGGLLQDVNGPDTNADLFSQLLSALMEWHFGPRFETRGRSMWRFCSLSRRELKPMSTDSRIDVCAFRRTGVASRDYSCLQLPLPGAIQQLQGGQYLSTVQALSFWFPNCHLTLRVWRSVKNDSCCSRS